MIIHKAYKFELDPNDYTKKLLFKAAGVARFTYNWSLARRIERFNTKTEKDRFTNYTKESKALNAIKSKQFPWMYEVSSTIITNSLSDLDEAFSNFWKDRKKGVGFPKFKRKSISKDSFTLYQSIEIHPHHITLPRLGKIRTKNKDNVVPGKILSATVSRTADRWFVSIATEQEISEQIVNGPIVGVDLGISTFATLSDGNKIDSPNPLKNSLAKLRRANKSHARKQKGSQNRRKSAVKLARIHARVANVRKDFLHKLTTQLTKTKSIIVVEDLFVKGMQQNKYLARAISDQGFGEFRRQLSYKSVWCGSKLIVANRWFASSKTCSNCNYKLDKLELSVRSWICPSCGVVHDRDLNAAKNLENLAYPRVLGTAGVKSEMSVEIPLTAEQNQIWSTSYESLKQEVA